MADPEDLLDPRIQVVVVPPNEEGAAGRAELQALGEDEDETPMDELAARPWLAQAGGAVRGAELETLGLAVYAGHRELALVNVPTPFIASGVRLLKELGTYVLAGGELNDGDVLQIRHDLPAIIGITAPADPQEPGPAHVVLLA